MQQVSCQLESMHRRSSLRTQNPDEANAQTFPRVLFPAPIL